MLDRQRLLCPLSTVPRGHLHFLHKLQYLGDEGGLGWLETVRIAVKLFGLERLEL